MNLSKQIALSACRRALAPISLCLVSVLAPQVWAQTQPDATGEAISLPWALQQTLLSNPELQSFPFDLRIAEAQALQAGIRPNPRLSLSVENVLGTGASTAFKSAETTLAFSQLIELGDKRQRRIDVAEIQQRQQLSDYELQRLSILAETTRRYYQVLRLQALNGWSDRRIEVEQRALAAIQRRARAGGVSDADVAKMALRLARSQALRRQLHGQTKLAHHRLSAMWASEQGFNTAAGSLAPAELPTAATVLNAIEQAPAYLQLRNLEQLAAAQTRLQQAKNQFDVTVGMGIRRNEATDDSGLTLDFSMPLQFSPPNQGNLLAARETQARLEQQQRLLRQQLRLSLLETHQAMSNNQEQANELQDTLLPLAQRLLSDTESAYQTGRISVLQLVDAQNELFTLERQLIEAYSAVSLQLLELERITGHALSGTTVTTLPTQEFSS